MRETPGRGCVGVLRRPIEGGGGAIGSYLDDKIIPHEVDAQQQRLGVSHVVLSHRNRFLEGGRPLVVMPRI